MLSCTFYHWTDLTATKNEHVRNKSEKLVNQLLNMCETKVDNIIRSRGH